jgi:hypothetical protein
MILEHPTHFLISFLSWCYKIRFRNWHFWESTA